MYKSVSMLLLGLYAQSALAAPTISSIENTEVESGPKITVVVNGSGFGQGPDVKFFEDFSAFEAGDVYTKSDLPEGFDADLPPGDLQIDEYRGMKGFNAYNYDEDGTSIFRVDLGAIESEVFVSYSVVVPEGRTLPAATEPETIGGGWKLAWLRDSGSRVEGDDAKFDLVIPTIVSNRVSMAGNNGSFISNQSDGRYTPPDMLMSDWWAWNEYNHMGVWFSGDADDPVRSTAYLSVVNDFVSYRSGGYEENAVFNVEQSAEPKFDQVNFPGWMRKRDDDNFQAIYTNLYIAAGENHKARIEVTNSANYEDSKFRKTLMVDSWGDDQIKFNALKSDLKLAGNLFVHVFDRNGKRVERGQMLCVACPVIEGN